MATLPKILSTFCKIVGHKLFITYAFSFLNELTVGSNEMMQFFTTCSYYHLFDTESVKTYYITENKSTSVLSMFYGTDSKTPALMTGYVYLSVL